MEAIMRLRHVTLALLTVAALGAAPLVLADPLDRDSSFGGDGIVKIDGWQRVDYVGEQALATQGRRIFVAGGALGAGSGESSLYLGVRGRKGRFIRSNGGHLERTSPFPKVRDVLIAHRRVYVVGWLNGGYDWKKDVEIHPYGFVAAFRRGLKGNSHWGTDRYFTYDEGKKGDPGLQRLRKAAFGSVTGGGIDSQGRVLVTGRIDGQTGVLRLTRDGRIDTSYGTNGLARVTIGSGSSPRDIAVHGTTAMIVGNATVNGHQQGFATQITGYGYRDRSFSGDGIRLIGKPGSHVSEARPAEAGRWVIAYELGRRAAVTKIGATGDRITPFGRHGRALIRCTRPDSRRVIDTLTTDRQDGDLHRITVAMSCRRDGDLRRFAAIWRPGGQAITSLKPNGVGRLPWHAATIDLTYTRHGRILGLVPNHLVRLR
jgi:hypothetical protein